MAAAIAGLLLAAGSSHRLGESKQLLRDEAGESLVARGARLLLEAGCAPVVVVVGANGAAVRAALVHLPVCVVENAEHARGMGSSIACGVLWLAANSAESRGVLIAACDMPTVDVAHLCRLIDLSELGTKRVASEYVARESNDDAAMMRGIPAVLVRADWLWLERLDGDRGAKPLLMETGTLTARLFRGMFDIDTPADVEAWRVSQSRLSPQHSPQTSTTPPELAMASQLAQGALADLEHEVANTRRMLERIPADQLDFTPHAKSWKLGKLANHLCDFPWWGAYTLKSTEINFADPMPPQPPQPTDAAGYLKQFDDRMDEFRANLAAATDAEMMETWTLRNGDQVLMSMPRIGVLRGMVISHMIHHRAQLTMYYRMLDVPVPGLYGPSADEQQITH